MSLDIKERGEYVLKSTAPFVDARGAIENYDLVVPVNMANIFTSKKGSLRANHFHPEQLQQVLVVSGKYISVYRDLTLPNAPLKSHVVKAGDLVITPAMVAHCMIFIEDSVCINLVGGNRDHDKFGQHTVPYVLVKPEEAQSYLEKHKAELQSQHGEGRA